MTRWLAALLLLAIGSSSASAQQVGGGVNAAAIVGTVSPANGGTGVNNGTNTLTVIGGNAEIAANPIVANGDPTGVVAFQAALQTAITQACALTPPASVFIPRGTYLMVSRVTTCSGLTLFGDGPGTTTLISSAGNDGTPNGSEILASTNAAHVRVRGITFDGNSANNPAVGTRLVFINGGDDVVFEDVIFQNSNSTAIAFGGGTTAITNSGVRRSYFNNIGMYWNTGGGGGLFANAKSAMAFANGTVLSNFGNFVTDTSFALIGGDSVDINAQSHFTASNNRLNLSQSGWRPTGLGGTFGVGGFYVLAGSIDVTIDGNTIDGATSQNIAVGDGTAVRNVTVSGNTLKNAGGSNIAISTAVDGFTVTGNTLSDSYQSTNYAVPNTINQGSITFLCGTGPCSGTVSNGIVSGNNILDDQNTPTTPFGVWVESGVTLSGVTVALTNVVVGATSASFSGVTPTTVAGTLTVAGTILGSPGAGTGQIGSSATGGLIYEGNGSTNDHTWLASNGTSACIITHNSTNLSCGRFQPTGAVASGNSFYLPAAATPGISAGSVKVQDWTATLSTFYQNVNLSTLSASLPVYTDGSKTLTNTAPAGYSAVLSGTSGSIGGSPLLAGACAAGTATVTGATSSMVATASPSADPDSVLSTGIAIYAFVSSSNTVTVRVCAIVAVTPSATTYNVRVLQ